MRGGGGGGRGREENEEGEKTSSMDSIRVEQH